MKVVLNNIKVSAKHSNKDIFDKAEEVFKAEGIIAENLSLYRKSLDARRKNNIHYVCAVIAEIKGKIEKLNNSDIKVYEETFIDFSKGDKSQENTIVVGTGPCGLFSAYILAKAGKNPLIIERGADVDERSKIVKAFWSGEKLSRNTNVQFGEGGAGTFSDGKLTTRIGDPLQRLVLETFVKFGAPEDILYKAKPHIGTDKLKIVVKNMREEIKRLGGRVLFNKTLTDVKIANNNIISVIIDGEEYPCDNLVLAIGHSSRDTYEMLYKKGVFMTSKAFAAGVRIEHKQSFINEMQYGKNNLELDLPIADYRLTYNGEKRSCYSFCMCPGGTVVNASSEDDGLVVNGMSEYSRDKENANSALVVTVNPTDFENDSPLAGIEFQRKYEKLAFIIGGGKHSAPIQKAKDFVNGKISSSFEDVVPSYTGKTVFADLRECLPSFISETLRDGLIYFENKVRGYTYGGAVLTGIEMRTSAPIRILRNETLQSINIKGLYPAGEGAGYAGGIMSAAVDGIKIALKISKIV